MFRCFMYVLCQGHSLRCTESFMHENVMDEMRQIQPEDETKRKMLDILKRFHSEEEMECEEEDGMIRFFSGFELLSEF